MTTKPTIYVALSSIALAATIIFFTILIIVPTRAAAMTDAEAKRQLALESQNLASFGNPFGKTGKFEELYDPTGKPWWMIVLDKEAWSMETYGNPFGYFIPQRVLGAPLIAQGEVLAPAVAPITLSPVVEAPSPSVQEPIQVEAPHFVGSPYFADARPYISDTMTGAVAVAIRFSEPLPRDGGASQPYRLVCVNPSNPNGIGIVAGPLSDFDDGTHRVAIVYSLGSGHYSCRFKFTQPITVESEAIEFDVE